MGHGFSDCGFLLPGAGSGGKRGCLLVGLIKMRCIHDPVVGFSTYSSTKYLACFGSRVIIVRLCFWGRVGWAWAVRIRLVVPNCRQENHTCQVLHRFGVVLGVLFACCLVLVRSEERRVGKECPV